MNKTIITCIVIIFLISSIIFSSTLNLIIANKLNLKERGQLKFYSDILSLILNDKDLIVVNREEIIRIINEMEIGLIFSKKSERLALYKAEFILIFDSVDKENFLLEFIEIETALSVSELIEINYSDNELNQKFKELKNRAVKNKIEKKPLKN